MAWNGNSDEEILSETTLSSNSSPKGWGNVTKQKQEDDTKVELRQQFWAYKV